MITTIQLSITEGPSLPASALEKLVALATSRGLTADELLAELILREVSDTPPPPPLPPPLP